jgi:hypothetical protein
MASMTIAMGKVSRNQKKITHGKVEKMNCASKQIWYSSRYYAHIHTHTASSLSSYSTVAAAASKQASKQASKHTPMPQKPPSHPSTLQTTKLQTRQPITLQEHLLNSL